MKWTTPVLSAVFLLSSLLSFAAEKPAAAKPASRKVAVLAGASGEDKAENFMVKDLRDFNGDLRARGWDVHAVVGSRDGLIKGSVKDTNAHLASAVRSALEGAKSGDEVLVLLHSHGFEQESGWAQKTHSIQTEDENDEDNAIGFNVDSLEPLFAAAEKRGVHTALVDLSCYSGSTQAISGPQCTATLASKNYVSLCSGRPEERLFNSSFLHLPPKGTPANLQDQFLAARSKDVDSINLPQLSSIPTPAADRWDDLLAELDPLDTQADLYNLNESSDDVKDYDYSPLLSETESAWPSSSKSSSDSKVLRKELEARAKTVAKLRGELEAAIPDLSEDYDEKSITLNLPGRAPFEIAPGVLNEVLERSEMKDDDLLRTEGMTQAQIDFIQLLRPTKDSLLKQVNRSVSAYKTRRDNFDQKKQALEKAAGKLFEIERKIYQQIAVPAQTSSGCKDFSL